MFINLSIYLYVYLLINLSWHFFLYLFVNGYLPLFISLFFLIYIFTHFIYEPSLCLNFPLKQLWILNYLSLNTHPAMQLQFHGRLRFSCYDRFCNRVCYASILLEIFRDRAWLKKWKIRYWPWRSIPLSPISAHTISNLRLSHLPPPTPTAFHPFPVYAHKHHSLWKTDHLSRSNPCLWEFLCNSSSNAGTWLRTRTGKGCRCRIRV